MDAFIRDAITENPAWVYRIKVAVYAAIALTAVTIVALIIGPILEAI